MDNRRKIGDVNASLQDTLAGIRVVQSFTNEEIERKKFQKSNHAFLLSKKRIITVSEVLWDGIFCFRG